MAASNEVVWSLIRSNNCYLRKRNNVQFTADPMSLTAVHNYKYSGLANSKAVSIKAVDGATVVTMKGKKGAFTTKLTKDSRRQMKSMSKVIGQYRPDLKDLAIRRISAVTKSLRVTKAAAKK